MPVRPWVVGTTQPGGLDRARRRVAATIVVAATALAATVALELVGPSPVSHPAFEASLATCGVLAAAAALWALLVSFERAANLRDLLSASTVVTLLIVDLVSLAGPATLQFRSTNATAIVPVLLLASLVAAAGFMTAARMPTDVRLDRKWHWGAIGIGAGVALAAAVEVAGRVLRDALAPRAGHLARVTSTPRSDPVLLAAVILAALIAVLAALAVLVEGEGSSRRRSRCEAWSAPAVAAATLLMAAGLLGTETHALRGSTSLEPAVATWLAACGLISFAAFARLAAQRRLAAEALVERDRQRLARDLHDGLCQDLAFIAAHGARIATESGDDHPIAIAARRALAASRGTLAELSASDAPTTRDALRSVADELALRFGIVVDVRARAAAIPPEDRDSIVRIAREAVVNAARHGNAQRVDISLAVEGGHLVLRVEDDGCGLEPAQVRVEGFGMTVMRVRATELGGRLQARRRDGGGTELEVVMT